MFLQKETFVVCRSVTIPWEQYTYMTLIIHEMLRKTRQGNTTERQSNTTQLAQGSNFQGGVSSVEYTAQAEEEEASEGYCMHFLPILPLTA